MTPDPPKTGEKPGFHGGSEVNKGLFRSLTRRQAWLTGREVRATDSVREFARVPWRCVAFLIRDRPERSRHDRLRFLQPTRHWAVLRQAHPSLSNGASAQTKTARRL